VWSYGKAVERLRNNILGDSNFFIILAQPNTIPMKLFANESTITTSDDKKIILTTHRIRADFGAGADGGLTSIMLGHISSIQLSSQSYPIFLIIGALMVLAGFGIGASGNINRSAEETLIVAGLVVAAIYFFTRRHTCIISSHGTSKIVFSATSMKREQLLAFIDQIEQAQAKRDSGAFVQTQLPVL
jgi:hypothetical protein